MNQEDFDEHAFEVLEKVAGQNVADAQFYVGFMYSPFSNQRDVQHDAGRGFELLKDAAENDHYDAAFYVGESYFQGEARGFLGFAKASEEDAIEWFQKARRSDDESIRERAEQRLAEIEEIQRKREEARRAEEEHQMNMKLKKEELRGARLENKETKSRISLNKQESKTWKSWR